MTLTPKQEAFGRAYIETGNASEAYRRAYSIGNMKPETIHKRSSELMANGEVKGRIEELQAAHQKRHDITVDGLTQQLIDDRALAHAIKNPSAAVSATMGMAKLHGLIRDKNEVSFQRLTHEEALAELEDEENAAPN